MTSLVLADDEYCDQGAGSPAVLMSHGTLMDWTMFRSQIDALSPHYRVIAYNLRAATRRGYDSPYTLETLSEDCLRIADQFEIDTFVLVGMSMGGYMALDFALRFPQRLRGLVLIDSMAAAYSDDKKLRYAEAFGPLNIDGPLPRAFAEWCAPICFGPRTIEEQPELVRSWVERWTLRPARSVYGEYRSWIDKSDLSDDLAQIDVPTLIIHGEDDAGLPLEEFGLPMAKGIRQSTMVVIPGAGHTSNCERPAEVNIALLDFLKGLPS